MNFRDYEKYTLNEEHRRMFQLMGSTPQPLNEQRSKYKQGRNKVKVKPGKGDKDYKLVVTKDYQFDPNNLSLSDMAFKIIKDHSPIASVHPDLSPEQLIFSTRKDGRRRDVFTFMIVDKQLPPEKKEEIKKETEKLVVQVDVDKAEKEAEKEDGGTQPDPSTETNTESRICNLRGDKTWEYKVEDEMWYTRKQGSSRWIKLGGDKYIKARCKLDKGCPGFRKTKEQNCNPQKLGLDDKPIGKRDNSRLSEGCSERAIRTFHRNMMTEINGTGSAGGTADGFANVVKRGQKNHKYYCKCMNRNNYEALGLEVTDTVTLYQNKWRKTIGCKGTPRDQDLPKNKQPTDDKDFPLTEGCTTEGSAGIRSKCQIVPDRIPPGMSGTMVIGYYYDPKQRKCVMKTMGGGPFNRLKKCQQCCESKR